MRRFVVTFATVTCVGTTGVVSAHAIGTSAAGLTSGTSSRAVGSAELVTDPATSGQLMAALPASSSGAMPTAARPLRIRTTWLAGAERTRSYRTTLTATGGRAPYRWSLSSGTLPRGLVLSRRGVISGKPPASGATEFTVRVKDARGTVTRRALSLAVAPRGGFRLTTTSIGPVKLPATPNPALTTLRGLLGTPTRQYSGDGCPLWEPRQRQRNADWGGFSAMGTADTDAAMTIDSWSLTAGRLPVTFATPYGVTLGTTLSQVRSRVPGVEVKAVEGMDSPEYMAIKRPMMWLIDGHTKRVTGLFNNYDFCDWRHQYQD